MNIKAITPKPPAITADGTVPLTPEQIVEQLRILRQHIPDFGQLTVTEAAAIRQAALVDDRLVQAAASSIGASPSMSSALGKDAATLRVERDDVSRWQAVEDEVQALHKGVASANLVRRHRLGLTALQAYAIARQLARRPEHADLLPHVDLMRQANRFGRKRRLKPAEPPTPATPTPAK